MRNPFEFLKESVESSFKWLAFLEDSSGFLDSVDSLRKHGGSDKYRVVIVGRGCAAFFLRCEAVPSLYYLSASAISKSVHDM